jgi:hypothetical protein
MNVRTLRHAHAYTMTYVQFCCTSVIVEPVRHWSPPPNEGVGDDAASRLDTVTSSGNLSLVQPVSRSIHLHWWQKWDALRDWGSTAARSKLVTNRSSYSMCSLSDVSSTAIIPCSLTIVFLNWIFVLILSAFSVLSTLTCFFFFFFS